MHSSVGLGCRPFVIQGQEAGQDFFFREGGGPSVGGEDGLVEGAMGVVEPGALAFGALVVEVGEGTVLQFFGCNSRRAQPCIAEADEFAGGVGDGFHARGWIRLAAPKVHVGANEGVRKSNRSHGRSHGRCDLGLRPYPSR